MIWILKLGATLIRSVRCLLRKVAEAYMVTFKNCEALDICKSATYPAIYLEVPDYYTGSFNLGGYVFKNLILKYDTEVSYFTVRGATLPTLDKLSKIS